MNKNFSGLWSPTQMRDPEGIHCDMNSNTCCPKAFCSSTPKRQERGNIHLCWCRWWTHPQNSERSPSALRAPMHPFHTRPGVPFVPVLSEQNVLSMAARMMTGTVRSLIPLGSKHFPSSDLTGVDSLGPLGPWRNLSSSLKEGSKNLKNTCLP